MSRYIDDETDSTNVPALAFSLVEVTLALGIRRLLLNCSLRLDARRRADKSQRDFSDCCYQYHRLRDRGYAGDNILDIPAIRHHIRHCENIVLRCRRTVYDIIRCEFAVPRQHNISFKSVRFELCRC